MRLPEPAPPAETPRAGWVRRRVLIPLRAQLTQGATPEKLALSVALGIALGLLPLFGTTTLLCLAVAVALRLNHPAIQIANQSMYLAQVPLIVVFVRLGEAVVGAAPIVLSPAALLLQLRANPLEVALALGRSGLHGLVGWALVAPALGAAVYAVLLVAFRRSQATA